jgi:hypothetical protein
MATHPETVVLVVVLSLRMRSVRARLDKATMVARSRQDSWVGLVVAAQVGRGLPSPMAATVREVSASSLLLTEQIAIMQVVARVSGALKSIPVRRVV